MPKASLGEFEHRVLLAILRLGAESYSVPIVLELEDRTGKSVAPAAVYIALRRLESHSLVSSRLDSGDPGGRERRYFKIEEPGMNLLRVARRDLVRLWEGLDPVLDEQ